MPIFKVTFRFSVGKLTGIVITLCGVYFLKTCLIQSRFEILNHLMAFWRVIETASHSMVLWLEQGQLQRGVKLE